MWGPRMCTWARWLGCSTNRVIPQVQCPIVAARSSVPPIHAHSTYIFWLVHMCFLSEDPVFPWRLKIIENPPWSRPKTNLTSVRPLVVRPTALGPATRPHANPHRPNPTSTGKILFVEEQFVRTQLGSPRSWARQMEGFVHGFLHFKKHHQFEDLGPGTRWLGTYETSDLKGSDY